MKTRMASARCCCGPGGQLVCDPISGYSDEFDLLAAGGGPGRWEWSTLLGNDPFVSAGQFVVEESGAFSRGPLLTMQRCAVWDQVILGGTWPTAVGFQYRMWYSFEAFPTSTTIDGVSLFFQLRQAGTAITYSVTHGLAFVSGTGWRNRITLQSPARPAASVYAGGILQAAQFPSPQGPFVGEMIVTVTSLPSQLWFASVTFNGTNVLGYPAGTVNRPVNTDASGVTLSEFLHGFSAGVDVKAIRVSRWQYTA